jgi:phage terminase large subunit-like protein
MNELGIKTATRVKNIIEKGLKHTIGQYAGTPFILQDWQWERIIKPLYGTLNPDGSRQYRTCLVMLPRKNGKSTLAAAIALYHLFADHEMGGQIYSAATDRDQASLVFNEAASMVRSNPKLLKRCKIIDSQKRIVDYRTNSFYRAIAADAAGSHGYNASCIIYDELHAAANRELFDVLSTSTGSRKQPLLFIISTAGYDRNSILYEQYSYAKNILKGIKEDKTFLPVIYEADEKDDWKDEANWYKANPALGTFRIIDEMRALYNKASSIPALQNTFKNLYLNMWTSQETRWLGIDKWDACPDKIDVKSLEGKVCYGGLDLSATTDLTSFNLAFPDGEEVKTLSFNFIPKEKMLEKIKVDQVDYDIWEQQGHIIATEGNVVDYNVVQAKIEECLSKYQVQSIAYDRWNATKLVQDLIAGGYDHMIPLGQGYQSLNNPTKHLETLILNKKLNHGNNPVLRWSFDNVMITMDPAGNIKPDKSKSKQRIDSIVALIMAIDGVMKNIDTTSIYETEGIKAF